MITTEEWMDLLSHRQMAAAGATWAEIARLAAADADPLTLQQTARPVAARGQRHGAWARAAPARGAGGEVDSPTSV